MVKMTFIYKNLLKKLSIIFLVSLLCGLGLGAEKYFFGDFVTKSDVFYITSIIKVKDVTNNGIDTLNFKGLLMTSENIYGFIDQCEKNGNVDFSQLNANWNKMDKNSKITWFQKMLKIQNFNHDVYEVLFQLGSFTPKNTLYLQDKAPYLMREFIKYSENFVKKIEPNATIEVIDQESVIPETIELSKKKIVVKYSIIGFIIGGIISVFGVTLWSLRKGKDGI